MCIEVGYGCVVQAGLKLAGVNDSFCEEATSGYE